MRYTAVLVTIAACGAAVPALPSKGGPAWIELQSNHFTLWTDGSESDARDLLGRMEHLHQVVVGTGFPSFDASGRNFVIALRDDAEFHAYAPEQFSAFAMSADSTPLRQPMIVMSLVSNVNETARVQTHELTHVISFGVLRRQPRWFSEGIAEFYETLDLDAGAGTVDIGRAPTYRGRQMVMHHMTSLEKLLACKDLACSDEAFYTTAWAFYTYLANTRGAQLATFETLLGQMPAEQAFAQAFGNPDLDALRGELGRWLVNGSHQVTHFRVKLLPYEVKRRTLGDGDALAVRALLRYLLRDDDVPAERAHIETDLAAALAADPTQVLGRALAMSLKHTVSLDEARATRSAHPDDWLAWMMLAYVSKGPEQQAALVRACTLARGNHALATPSACDELAAQSTMGQ